MMAPRGSVDEICEAVDVLFTSMQIHEIEPQPGSTSVDDCAEPGLSRSDDFRRDACLEFVGLGFASTGGLETSAADR